MKRYNYIGIAMMAAGMLAATSCTDFSDYNEVPVDQNGAGNQTLWENIQQDSRLTGFASLVRKAGFESELNTPRSLTVWAPLDGTYNLADFEALSQEDLLTQFVKGHIAEYGHAATGSVDERVHMLNEKSFQFSGNGAYTFGGLNISQANVPSNNGLLHLLDGVAKFYPNLYEYLKVGEGIDSLRNQFMRYEVTTLDQSASVKGPMVDGVQTYIDSVMVTTNSLINQLNARLQNEDSSYTFIMPTDEAFLKMKKQVEPYFKFLGTTNTQNFDAFTKADDKVTKSITVDANYMTDSLVRRAITRNLIYSNNDMYNQWILGGGEFTDTLRSTTRNKFSNPREILEEHVIGEPIEMSNGYVRLVDTLAFFPWETFCPELEFSPRNNMAALYPNTAQRTNINVTSANGQPLTWLFGPETTLTNYRYAMITPGGDRAKADFYIAMPGVQSTTYNIYVVFMPTGLLSGAYNETRPNWLNFQLYYTDAKGNLATQNFTKAYADSLLTGGPLPAIPAAVSATTAFTNDPMKTDTLFIGRFNFPVNYNGLGADYYPSIRVSSPISVFNSTQLATYSRDVCIAAILLRPVELDEYEAKNK